MRCALTAVLGFGRDTGKAVKRVPNAAYPRVISNLGTLGDTDGSKVAQTMIRYMNHYARGIREREKIIKFFRADKHQKPGPGLSDETQAFKPVKHEDGSADTIGTTPFLGLMYDYFTTGFANTVGWAHANSGDTMTSVMIGGLRTVQNGDFEVFAGDVLQFYW